MIMLTILIALIGWIITICVAIYTVKRSSEDTDKKIIALQKSTQEQIAAIERSTKDQVDSIKEMSRLQIDATIQQVDVELAKNVYLAQQAQEEQQAIQEINKSPFSHVSDYRDNEMRKFQEEKPQRDLQRYSEYIQMLEEIKKGLESYKNKLN
jgi:hypothetical protein